MTLAINASISGLNAASTRVSVAANNLANQSSVNTNTDGVAKPYTAKQAVQTSQAGGGVDVTIQQTNDVPDTAQQLIDAKIASYDFKANLKAIQVQDDLVKNALNIIA